MHEMRCMAKKYTKIERSFKDIEVERASRDIGEAASRLFLRPSSFPEMES